MHHQLTLLGETREEEAVRFIREHEPEEGYYLGFSGGKDSQVLYKLTEMAGVKFLPCYSCTGIDPPEVVRFIRKNYPRVKFLHPQRSFFKAISERGFPMRFTRWCCDELKKDPARKIPLKHRLMGIRAEESRMRAARPIIDKVKRYGQIIYKPMFYWLEWEVWDFLERHGIEWCELYDEGWDRLGCVVCPFICHGRESYKLKRSMERWPKIYHAFEKAMRKRFDDWCCVRNPRSGALNFRREWDFDEFLDNWYAGK